MDHLIDTIRAGIADGAPPEAKLAGATACRTILAAIDVAPGQALTVVPRASPNPFSALGQLDVTQVLDLVITKLRTMVPAEAAPRAPAARFHVPILTPPRGAGRVR